MASVPSVTLNKLDCVVLAVADRILAAASDNLVPVLTLCESFRNFADGVAVLIGPVSVLDDAEPSAVEHL